MIVNLRLDPFERTGLPTAGGGSLQYASWFTYEFWRFVFVHQVVTEVGKSFVEFPPMQKGASFNLETVKAQIEKAIQAQAGQ
jgi:arylsulfatase